MRRSSKALLEQGAPASPASNERGLMLMMLALHTMSRHGDCQKADAGNYAIPRLLTNQQNNKNHDAVLVVEAHSTRCQNKRHAIMHTFAKNRWTNERRQALPAHVPEIVFVSQKVLRSLS